MKKIISNVIVCGLLFLAIGGNVVYAASNYTSSVNRTNLSTGGSAYIYFSLNDNTAGIDAVAEFSGNVTSTGGARRVTLYDDSGNGFKGTIPVIATGPGTGRVTIKGSGYGLNSGSFKIDVPAYVFTVSAPSKNDNTPSEGTYKPVVESEADKNARLEREAKEKAEKEQKTPLIGGFEVISNDTKMNGKVLGKIETKFESFEYESMLPLFVNKVTLKVTGVKEGAKVTFEANHDVNDKPVSVKVQASLGDVKQEFTINLKPSDKRLFKYENEGVVYHDEAVDKVMASFGFKPEAIKIDSVDSSVYVKGSLKLQLIMNDAKQLMFYRLDEGLKVESKGYLLAAEGGSVYVTADAVTSDLAKETLRGKGYQKVTLDAVPYFESIDSALVYQPTFYGWEFEEGYVVIGSDGTLENDLFHVNPTHRVSAAVVAFDVQNPTLLYVSIGLGVALAAVSGAFIANYVSVDRKFKRLKNR